MADIQYRNPLVTVDIIIENGDGIVLIERQNFPYGWALPGGFVDYGESLENAAKREAKEETSMNVNLVEQFHCYSDPDRDPRHHTVTTVYIAEAEGIPKGSDDAKKAQIFAKEKIPDQLTFDHDKILEDYFRYKSGESKKDIFASHLL
jgi:ADP-ribose pyrophosphatase YjhB (NUDIX family)